MRPACLHSFLAIALGLLLACNLKAQESVTGVVQNATTKRAWVRADAVSGAMVPLIVSQLTVKTDAGSRRYSIGRNASVATPDGGRTIKVGDYVEVFFTNGQVSEVKVRKLVGTIANVATRTNVATEILDGQAVAHREATYLSLKGRQGTWEVGTDAKITSADGAPADAVHGGDQVELTFTDGAASPLTRGRVNAVVYAWEISDIKILKAKGAEAPRQYKLVGVVTHVETAELATDVRHDRVPGTGRWTEKAMQSKDFTFVTLKDKGRWQASSKVRIMTSDGTVADGVHVGDEVEMRMRAREIEEISILKPVATSVPERWSTKIRGAIERTQTYAVPIEMHNGEVTKTRDVTKITMRDTGETWELSRDVKIQLSDGIAANAVRESDEVELTLRGKLVTEVRILKRQSR
jgi:hypothetical protein